MHATVGDELQVQGHVVGIQERIGEIVEVRGPEGTPPYLVRFEDGHEGLVYPGPDCLVRPRPGD
ncbi:MULTISPECIES: DUF1918 domain-containing protein [Actinosynnema]|uniref:DUF1918 domain-containing protein n=1 Tax=Actinosynnema TaxID=40566 RepID=UPI0020A4523E|nr:DUF1918 domain-containing protein [Actinosynnema pretiosum]MCP2095370.1 protein of unknown function (DUF1918) [Actinosynnema pretiosum]